MTHQEHLSPRSALLSKANRRRQEEHIAERREHLALVEALQKKNAPPKPNGAARQNGAPARDPRREALATAIDRANEAEAALQAARLIAGNKQRESWEAKRAVNAAQGIVTATGTDYALAASQEKAKGEAKRYLADAAAAHAQWLLDRELGKPVGEEPPTVEQIKRQVESAQAGADDIDAVRTRLDVEVTRRQADVVHAKAGVKNAAGKVLLSAFTDLVEHYLAQRDRLAVLRENVRVLFRVADTSPTHRHWDSIANEPQNNTGPLREAIANLERDPDTDLSAVLEAIKDGQAQVAPPPAPPRDEAFPRPGYNRYGGRIS